MKQLALARWLTLAHTVLPVLALACSGGDLLLPGDSRPAAVAILQGNNQTAPVGTALPDSLVVRVTDAQNRPVAEQRVAFVPATADAGSLAPDTAVTDDSGRAAARWVLGPTPGTKTVEARAVGSDAKAAFTATAVAGKASPTRSTIAADPTSITAFSGASTVTVRARDDLGNPIAGLTATPIASPTTASFEPASARTDAQGVATFTFRATAAKTYTVSARLNDAPIAASVTVNVGKAPTATTITAVRPEPSQVLLPVEVSFQVSAASAPTPSGSVSVTDGSAGCTATVAQGSCSLTPTSAGDKTIVATYLGSADFASSSASAPHRVELIPTTVTDFESSDPDAQFGRKVTFSAKVRAAQLTPAGVVVFAKDACPAEGGTTLASDTLDGEGEAKASTTALPFGTYDVFACYQGTAAFAPSQAGPIVQTVGLF